MSDEKKAKKPPWLKIRFEYNQKSQKIEDLTAAKKLHSVCQSAHCPNKSECWADGTATFMIMGDQCTRACRFCAVKTIAIPLPLDTKEPEKLAETVTELGLQYVVLTSVTRDDLPDYGAEHFAECIEAIKKKKTGALIEVLVPDFCNNDDAIEKVIDAEPEVIGHNIETVQRLSPIIRDRRAEYSKSLSVLAKFRRFANAKNKKIITKSGLMVGLGEKEDEVREALSDLREVGVDIVTIGQYLRPSSTGTRHVDVVEYVTPEKFVEYEKMAYKIGFKYVASGPLVRSSYRAAQPFIKGVFKRKIPFIKFPFVT